MNSGLQDAFNLAWKLALVCQGHCSPALLDSYEAERRPVAERVVASGDAAERVQGQSAPTERRSRDATLRAVFADPTSRHHESVAEAELDIDYSGSPIVMGDPSDTLGPGQRLPDTIQLSLAGGGTRLLHELTFRIGHTALLIGGSSVDGERIERVSHQIESHRDSSLIEEVLVITSSADVGSAGLQFPPDASDLLGASDTTLLVVRPDGHIGLRADHDHLDALTAYQARLVANRF